MAYLITCAGSKQTPIETYESTVNQLSYSEHLLVARQQVIAMAKIDLDWSRTLPAWKLYSGNASKLYPRITEENWQKPCVEIKILSALFGLIRHTDLVPIYNLKMSNRIGVQNKLVWRIWCDMNLLGQLVEVTDIDLLSKIYRKAINRNGEAVANTPNRLFKGYGIEKGIWLNTQLDNVTC